MEDLQKNHKDFLDVLQAQSNFIDNVKIRAYILIVSRKPSNDTFQNRLTSIRASTKKLMESILTFPRVDVFSPSL